MQEYVCCGEPNEVIAFRKEWTAIGKELLASWGLTPKLREASDPFFPRAASFFATAQRELSLKHELVIEVCSDLEAACASINYHEERFARVWNIRTRTNYAHTACIGFGLDRIALALFARYGCSPTSWPASIRERLTI
jgi:hypothetical protein